jgi:DNA-binding response OmpR family regulator
MPNTTVLIADDDPLQRRLLQIMLTSAGYASIEAVNGEELVQLARTNAPQLALIITDLEMPYRSGSEAIRALRVEPSTAHIPMILVSARGDTAAITAGIKSGADEYIVKPWNVQDLLACIAYQISRTAATSSTKTDR